MNKHLNIFKSYAKDNRNRQLENDLTRALAICLQEDALFFHEVLKTIIETDLYNQLFEDLDGDTDIKIEIQKQTSRIHRRPDKVFAVSLSESVMSDFDFWKQTRHSEYDPICDLVITINDILIVIEAKRDKTDCTTQLYNQIFNIFKNQDESIEENKEIVTTYDLNWKKLMEIAVKVASFEKTTNNINRFLSDFIKLVKGHKISWLPETPIASLNKGNPKPIKRRIESAINQFCKDDKSVEKLSLNRLGTTFSKRWADELLFGVDRDTGNLKVDIYPGNTKRQGYSIFEQGLLFTDNLTICGELYPTSKRYHIQFRGQSNITNLSLNHDAFSKPLYTKENFKKHTGRIKKDDWHIIEKLLTTHISDDAKWKRKWEDKILNSKRTQFNLSFGYRISINIPFNKLAQLDVDQNDIAPLAKLIGSIYKAFDTKLTTKQISA